MCINFVYLSKAFDNINTWGILWHALIKVGIRKKKRKKEHVSNIYIKSYQNHLSEDFECYLGVRQGVSLTRVTIMFPIFNMKLFLLLFADDIRMFSETADGLQRGLNVFTRIVKGGDFLSLLLKQRLLYLKKGKGYFCQEI